MKMISFVCQGNWNGIDDSICVPHYVLSGVFPALVESAE